MESNTIVSQSVHAMSHCDAWVFFTTMSDGAVWMRTSRTTSEWTQALPPLPDAAWVPGTVVEYPPVRQGAE